MTPGNVKRFKEIVKSLQQLVKENPDASTAMYVILKTQDQLLTIARDLHFRPEVNSEQ